MATRKPKVEVADQEEELHDAQAEVADYGRDAEVNSLTKAVQEATDGLSKAGKGKGGTPPPAMAGDDDEESDADEGDEGEGEDEEQDEDEDEGDEDGEGDGDEDAAPAPPPAPAAKKKSAPMQRSRSRNDEAERFLKSVLLDEDGEPTVEAEVIEVSDVLTHLTDVFAKSIGALQEEIGMVQLQLDEAMPLLKAMGHHQIATGKMIKSTRREMAQLRKAGAGGTRPAPGVTHSMKKSMPGVVQNGQISALTKSQAAAGLLAAFQTRAITAEQYQRLGPALDTQGVDAVLAQLPEGMADQIRNAATALNGNGTH